MFAIIRTGGKQYRVVEGEKLKVEKLDTPVGETVQFEDVLLTSDAEDKDVKIGTPNVSGAKVTAKVLRTEKAKKVMVIKVKPKKRCRTTRGHRQTFTEIEIVKIQA